MSMSHDEMIAVIQAHKDGKAIQAAYNDRTKHDDWHDTGKPVFNFELYDYRIKPEPRTMWVNEYAEYVSPYTTENEAKVYANSQAVRVAVKYQEVIE